MLYLGNFLRQLIFSTYMCRLVEDKLPLAVIEKKNGKKEIVLQEDDWNKLEIKMISELFVSN